MLFLDIYRFSFCMLLYVVSLGKRIN